MRIDSAIKVFSEKYDHEAIEAIEEISQERGLVLTGATMEAFNINESFNKFSQYIKEYAEYKVKNKDNNKASPQEAIRESVDNFINTQLIQESTIKYSELPEFVKGYINGVNTLTESVNEAKRIMLEGDVDTEAIGDVNDFSDKFMEKLHESFDPAMDNILLASGYTTRKRLHRTRQNKPKQPLFL